MRTGEVVLPVLYLQLSVSKRRSEVGVNGAWEGQARRCPSCRPPRAAACHALRRYAVSEPPPRSRCRRMPTMGARSNRAGRVQPAMRPATSPPPPRDGQGFAIWKCHHANPGFCEIQAGVPNMPGLPKPARRGRTVSMPATRTSPRPARSRWVRAGKRTANVKACACFACEETALRPVVPGMRERPSVTTDCPPSATATEDAEMIILVRRRADKTE